MNYRIVPQGPLKHPGHGMAISPNCEICGKHRSKYSHTKCSKIKQARFARERAA